MQKRIIIVLLAFATILAVVLAGCSGAQNERNGGGTTGSETGDVTVVERDLAFEPASVNVAVGDVVTFENEDSEPHEVEINGERLGIQQQGESVEWTANEAGEFDFFCTIHPSMTGKVSVKQ